MTDADRHAPHAPRHSQRSTSLDIYGVRAGGWLTEPRMPERICTTTAPAAVAAAALCTMREAARTPTRTN
ncbi:hypothetical protein [Streptomyces sp. NPDC005009]